MTIQNEFSRMIKLDCLGGGDHAHQISANAAEREALCARFDLLSIDRLTASIILSKSEKGVTASGRVQADLAQACAATGEPVPGHIDQPIAIIFLPQPDCAGETELDEEYCESMFHDGKSVDIGEAAAQTMGLAMNPYPRSKNAARILRAAGVISDDEALAAAGPFAALAMLRQSQ